MYILTCQAMGVRDCGYQVMGPSKEEVMRRMRDHGLCEHPGNLEHATIARMEDALEQA